MRTVLGLDIGTNSVGWALIQQSENQDTGAILNMGSRIVPMGDEKTQFEQGQQVTRNADRRLKRGARRNNQRYKQRRNKLVVVLHNIGLLPGFVRFHKLPEAHRLQHLKLLPVAKDTPQATGIENYELRKRALYESISKQDLGAILYQLNQRRGYAGGGEGDDNEETAQPEKTGYQKMIKTVTVSSIDDSGEKYKGKPIYNILLSDSTNATTMVEALKNHVGKEIEIELRIRTTKKGEVFTTVALPNKTEWRKQMESLEKELQQSGLHVGEHFYEKLLRNKWLKIRDRVVLRHRFEKEFDAIWKEQAKHHPELTNPSKETLQQIVSYLYPGKSQAQKRRELMNHKNPIYHIIRNEIIYYQRPLKSQKHSLSYCRFENKPDGKKKVCPKSAPIFQQFKIWQQINNLRLTDWEYNDVSVTDEQKEAVYQYLNTYKEANVDRLKKLMKLEGQDLILSMHESQKLKGNNTRNAIANALKKSTARDAILQSPEKMEKLWHILYSVDAGEGTERNPRIVAIVKHFKADGMDEDTAATLNRIKFKKEYGAMSAKAIRRILPLMKAGKYFDEGEIIPEVKARLAKLLSSASVRTDDIHSEGAMDSKNSEIEPALIKLFQTDATPFYSGGLQYWAAASLVYGKHTDDDSGKILESPDDIKALPFNSLRNPIVEQIVNETLHLVRDVWRQYGKPDEINVELARELKSNKAERDKMYKAITDGEKNNQRIRKRLTELGQATSLANIQRYKLWEECKHKSPYTGNTIEVTELFTEEYEIEHIIPKTRFFDDSLGNKTICEAGVNRDKGNLTAREYLEQGSANYKLLPLEEYMTLVNTIFFGKKRKHLLTTTIPEDFVERQKKDTQYIAVAVTKQLAKIVGRNRVLTTTGGITDYLRSHWGLHDMFREITKPRFENMEAITGETWIEKKKLKSGDAVLKIKHWSKRLDHRHHAIDALTVACTTRSHIKRLNDLDQEFDKLEAGKAAHAARKESVHFQLKSLRKFDAPWKNFIVDARNATESIITSHKSRKRLLTATMNRKEYSGKQHSVRGALHEETVYGQIKVREIKAVSLKEALAVLSDRIAQSNPIAKVTSVRSAPATDLPPAKRIRSPEEVGTTDRKTIVDKALQKSLHIRLVQSDGDIIKALKSLKEKPLLDASGKEIKKIEVAEYVPRFISRKKLNSLFTGPMVGRIADYALREHFIRPHFEAYGSDPKKAFSGEAIMELNRKRAAKGLPPVYSARVIEIRQPKPLQKKGSFNRRAFVLPGSNYCFAFLEKDEQRTYDIISFFDAVRMGGRLAAVLQYFKERHPGWKLLFTLSQNELVYVPHPNEDLEAIDWSDYRVLSGRIYRVVKFWDSRICFVPHQIAKELEKELGNKSPNNTEFLIEDIYKDKKANKIESIRNTCIKIYIDRLGKITPYWKYHENKNSSA